MYFPELLNSQNLFQHLPNWLGNDKNEPVAREIAYRVSSVMLSIARMEELNKACVAEVKPLTSQIHIDDELPLWSANLFQLLHEISPSISNLRIVQNLILPFLGKQIGLKSIPNSMSQIIKKGVQSYGFSESISTEVAKYWKNGGSVLKDYRDIDQHFFSVVDHSYLQSKPDLKIIVLLPDCKSTTRKAATFIERINAFEFISDALKQLDKLSKMIFDQSGFTTSPFTYSTNLSRYSDVNPGKSNQIAFVMRIPVTSTNNIPNEGS